MLSPKYIPLKTPYRIAIFRSKAENEDLTSINESNFLFHSKPPEHLKSHSPSPQPFSTLTLPAIRKPSNSVGPSEKLIKSIPPKSLSSSPSFQKFETRENSKNFTQREISLLTPNIPLSSRTVEFSSDSNAISFVNIPINENILRSLSELISKRDSMLQYLNLENSGISDKSIIYLSESLSNSRTLQHLCLARNNLTSKCAVSLKNMLTENYYLLKLDLHWNNLKDQGTLEIFEGLCYNASLKELDLSWNNVGKSREIKTVQSISNCIKRFQGLAHLDLSFNYFNFTECEILAAGLAENCEILGLHFAGNEGETDPEGYILPKSNSIQLKDSHLFTRIFQEGKRFRKPPNSFCWICEKWTEYEFEFEMTDFGRALTSYTNIFIHFEVDSYEAVFLPKINGKFRISRVLPLGNQQFFFSLNGEAFVNSYYLFKEVEEINLQVKYSSSHESSVSTCLANYVKVVGRPCDYKNVFRTLPRRPKFGNIRVSVRQVKEVWSIDRSIFKDPHYVGEEYYKSCLKFDWVQSKLSSFIKSQHDQQSIQQVLLKSYPILIKSFKFLSIQGVNDFPSIGNNGFIDFLNQGQFFDQYFSSSDLGVNWIAVIIPKKKQPYNPGNALVRYEFIELLVRISYDRYIRNGICSSITDAFQLFLREGLEKILQNNSIESWRLEFLYQEDIDNTLRLFKPLLEAIFKIYSGRKALPGQKPFMSLDEFKCFCQDFKLVDPTIPARDVDACFFNSMFWQVDELFEKRHIEMSSLEFSEAFCRAVYFSNSFDKNKSFKSRVFLAGREVLKSCPKMVQDSFVLPTKVDLNNMRLYPKKVK